MRQIIMCVVPVDADDCPSGVKFVIPAKGKDINKIKGIPKNAISTKIIDRSEVPQDRYFRNAWEFKDEKIEINMPRSIPIHQEKLRHLRKPKLEKLDIDYMRAIEVNDTVKATLIAAKKQELRDVTVHSLVMEAITPAELKAAIPPILNEDLNF